MDDQFHLFEGEALKEEGMARVAGNNASWSGNAARIVMLYAPFGQDFLAEIFKTFPGIGSPKHQNAWGALTSTLVRQGVLIGTGEYKKSKTPGNHAHKYQVYRRA